MTTNRLWVLPVVLIASAGIAAQQLAPDASGGPRTVFATALADVRSWDSTIDRMVRTRELVVLGSRPDPDLDGRRHETLAQFHQGIPVYGGTLSRQTDGGGAVSIIGTVFEGIDADPTPALSAAQAIAALAAASDGRPVGSAPGLVIFPVAGGVYRLAWRVTLSDTKTYLVDADTGTVLWTVDEMQTQSQVGVGTGALGDSKKISTTLAAGAYRTLDQARPSSIRTFDTRGVSSALDRLVLPPGASVDADFPVDADNTWANPPVVDAHVHTGWMHDYLFKQVGWTGIDNRASPITSAVHSGLLNNAFFISSPFGVDGRGMFVYGGTAGGTPLTPLDIVAHEMMHGVTHASLVSRTGNGLLSVLFIDGLGPTSINSNGNAVECSTAVAVFTDGRRLPLFCSGGRYVLLGNAPGAINEAFSDVFGIAAEFFHHPAGTGTLRADYKLGEDVVGFGPNRAADVPASLPAMPSSRGNMAYPDHASRTFRFLAAVSQGTPANPTALILLPWTIAGSDLVTLGGTDSGGVHVNATVLSHAFFLAIEGGRNATSGLTVQGVGAANRVQVERAFFRAMSVLMPNIPTMGVAAQATIQAATDLYGAGSPAATAIRQAMQAVGLVN